MVFSSVLFLSMFLPAVLFFYFLAGLHLRNYVLLAASLLFYAWGEPKAVWLMIGLIIASYYIARQIEKENDKHSVYWMSFGIILNLCALCYYKYWVFFLENINMLLNGIHQQTLNVPNIALPIGISFYTFQIISYLIDVYRGEVKAQKNIFTLATYVSLFPQLVAGPIVRYKTIAEDLLNRKTDFDNIFRGLRRFVIGLAKKVLIADQMAVIADKVFDTPVEQLPCFVAWVGALAYTLQIFYDFSGYSDMAIGLGRIFCFRFLENFEYPYSAKSVQEFWRRWHISLSSWFKDYLYIPLGGNRKGKIRTILNSYIVFALCGLWHGATWNFVFWGLYHGSGLMIERLGVKKILDKIPAFFANLYVWLFVIVGWVLFRAADLPHAGRFLRVMFTGNKGIELKDCYWLPEMLTYSNLWALLAGIFFSYPFPQIRYERIRYSAAETYILLAVFITAYVFAMTSTFSPFIYFRF